MKELSRVSSTTLFLFHDNTSNVHNIHLDARVSLKHCAGTYTHRDTRDLVLGWRSLQARFWHRRYGASTHSFLIVVPLSLARMSLHPTSALFLSQQEPVLRKGGQGPPACSDRGCDAGLLRSYPRTTRNELGLLGMKRRAARASKDLQVSDMWYSGIGRGVDYCGCSGCGYRRNMFRSFEMFPHRQMWKPWFRARSRVTGTGVPNDLGDLSVSVSACSACLLCCVSTWIFS